MISRIYQSLTAIGAATVIAGAAVAPASAQTYPYSDWYDAELITQNDPRFLDTSVEGDRIITSSESGGQATCQSVRWVTHSCKQDGRTLPIVGQYGWDTYFINVPELEPVLVPFLRATSDAFLLSASPNDMFGLSATALSSPDGSSIIAFRLSAN